MQPTLLAGTNFVLHAAGWLEGGLTMGHEKFGFDADQIGMWGAFSKGVDLSENGQALDAFLTNEPGAHVPRHAHTLATFETAFYRSSVADNSSFEQWGADGASDAAQRASLQLKRLRSECEPPPLDDKIREDLVEWIERKKASFVDSDV